METERERRFYFTLNIKGQNFLLYCCVQFKRMSNGDAFYFLRLSFYFFTMGDDLVNLDKMDNLTLHQWRSGFKKMCKNK